MKKIFSILLSFIIMNICFSSVEFTTFSASKNSYSLTNDDEVTEIIIPENNNITNVTIDNCNALKTIYIPETVDCVTIYDCPFLSAINVSSDNEYLKSIDGVLYDKNAETLILYPPAHPDKNPVIHDGVKIINGGACAYTSFESIELPESLEFIYDYAFMYNKNLKKINIPPNVNGNMKSVFLGCENLKEVTFQNDKLSPDVLSSTLEGLASVKYTSIFDNNNSEQIFVYVPDNKVSEYREISEFWHDVNSIIFPVSLKSDDFIPCDVNNDGKVNIADAVVCQKFLLNESGSQISNWKALDLCHDGKIDVFDYVMLKKYITQSYNPIIFLN